MSVVHLQRSSAGAGGVGSITFAPSGIQDASRSFFSSWGDFVAALELVPFGSAPRIVMALDFGVPFDAPLIGMPVDGWDMRGGTIHSTSPATGATVLNVPAGVKFKNLAGIDTAMVLKINPPINTGVLEGDANPFIFFLGQGAGVDHTTSPGALRLSPGTNPGGDTNVVASFGSQTATLGALSGPLLQLQGDDGGVGVQVQSFGGLPAGWLVGGGPASQLFTLSDSSGFDTTDPSWIPGFTGGGGATQLNLQSATMLPYSPSAPADWSGDPATTRAAIDRLAAAVAGLLGVPIP